MSFRGRGATNTWEMFVRNNATAGQIPPAPYPITASWWVWIDSLVSSYVSYFGMGPKSWEFGPNNWIASLGPFGPGSANGFAMSADAADNYSGLLLSDNMLGRWVHQGIIIWKDASHAHHRFYPDLRRPSLVGVSDVALPYFSGLQSSTIFFMGAPPWADQEGIDGKIGAIKIWRARLSLGDLIAEGRAVYPARQQYAKHLYGVYPAQQHFKNLNSSAGGNDLLIDMSGNGNHFFQSTSADNYAGQDTGGTELWAGPPIPQRSTSRIFLGLVSSAVAAPTVTDVGDESFRVGESGIVATVTNAGAVQGNGRIRICPTDAIGDVNGVNQTVTSWGDTSITFDVVRGSLSLNTNLYLFVENDGGQSNAAGYVVQITPPPAVLAAPFLLD